MPRTRPHAAPAQAPAPVQASALILATLVLILLGEPLTGCAKQSVAAQSAADMSFTAAMSQDYPIAAEAISQRAEDAKLLAIQSTTYAMPGSGTGWTFLFYSWQRASAYTVTVSHGEASVTDMPTVTLSKSDYDAIPQEPSLAIDADQAYQALLADLEGTGKLITCRAFLMTYVVEDSDPTASANIWFFSFNEESDVREAALDKSGEISPQRIIAVDAGTGQVTQTDTI